jgi:copper(I)-binding protein
MKLSAKTLAILKNFSTINQSILVRPGNVLRTMTATKTVIAKASVPDAFDREFAIYNVPQFMNCMSMFTEPDLSFGDTHVMITDNKRSFKYFYSEVDSIVKPPNKDLQLPSVDAAFRLTAKDMQDTIKAMGILNLPELAVVGDGQTITLQAVDVKNSSSSNFSVEVGETENIFRVIFKADNMKMIPGDYDVSISSKGISHFSSTVVEYFVAIEHTSTFG